MREVQRRQRVLYNATLMQRVVVKGVSVLGKGRDQMSEAK